MITACCKNCKYWTRDNENDVRFGNCEKLGYDVSNDRDYFTERTDVSNVPDDNVITSDYESYASWMATGQNFGCIHFESKEGGQ